MAYATRDDMEEAFGADLVAMIADRDASGQPDEDAIIASLDMASAEIDSYLATRYVVPVADPTAHIKQIALDIAIYRLAHDEAPRSVEMRLRYEDAIKWLSSVAKGTVTVPGAVSDTTANPEFSSSAAVVTLKRC